MEHAMGEIIWYYVRCTIFEVTNQGAEKRLEKLFMWRREWE